MEINVVHTVGIYDDRGERQRSPLYNSLNRKP
jgi:hypothetical protein